MILAEHRHHQQSSSEVGGSTSSSSNNNEEISLCSNVASWQSNKNKTTEEATAVVHRQPDQVKKVDDDDDDDDDDDEDSCTYSSSDEDEVDENKQNWVAKRLPEIPQPNVKNQVSNSNKVNISNTNKNVYEGNVVIHQNFYNNLSNGGIANPDRIDVAPEKITNGDKDVESNAAVGPKLSNVSSHPLYPFTQDKVTSWCTRRRFIFCSGAAVLVGIVVISLIIYFTTQEPTFPEVCFVARIDWTARPPLEEKPLAVSPAKYVIIMETKSVTCFTQSQCAGTVKHIQGMDMDDSKMTDIRYNWLVGGDGLIYTGRGWDVEGDHTKNYDNKSIGIAFIGNFENDSPSPAQKDKGEKLIKKGVELNKIDKDYILVARKQCITSNPNNPGEKLYNIIKEWDHYTPTCFSNSNRN